MLSYFSTKDKVKRMVNKGYILKIIDVKTSDLSDDVIEQNYESVREYFKVVLGSGRMRLQSVSK